MSVTGSQDEASLETLGSVFFTYKDPEFPVYGKTRSVLMPATGRLLQKLACLLFIVLVQGPDARAGDFLIHDGDRVVFLGDSITEQKLYTTYIEAYALTRHPDWSLTTVGSCWAS